MITAKNENDILQFILCSHVSAAVCRPALSSRSPPVFAPAGQLPVGTALGSGRRAARTAADDAPVADNDDPLPSGSGEVSKDCGEGELAHWGDVLAKWRFNLAQRPRGLSGECPFFTELNFSEVP